MPYSAKAKSVLEKEEVEDMIFKAYQVFGSEEEKALMVSSLVAFLWLSGCRISEALGVKREDVKMDQQYLYVTIIPLKQWIKTKDGTKRKSIPVSLVFPRKKTIFTKLILKQTIQTDPTHNLWDVERTTAWRYLTTLNEKIYPHLFRHSRATHFANSGLGDAQMKRWFGWSPTSTMPSQYILYSKIQMGKIGELIEE